MHLPRLRWPLGIGALLPMALVIGSALADPDPKAPVSPSHATVQAPARPTPPPEPTARPAASKATAQAANDGHASPEPAAVKAATTGQAPGPDDRWTGRDLAAVCAGIGGILAFFSALLSTFLTQKANRASMAQKSNETELATIERKRDGFFGPFLQLSETNRLLQSDLRDRQPDPASFRTMILLLDPDWRTKLKPGDLTMVEEIIRIDGQLELLIRRNSGLIDAALLPYLACSSVHFRMIRLAFKGKLDHDPQRYDKYVYPRSLNDVLELEVKRLQQRRNQLRASPDVLLPLLPALAIPEEHKLSPWSIKAPTPPNSVAQAV